MYIEIVDSFGWAPLESVFAEYRTLPADRRPGSDQEKRDQWMVRLSRAVGRNLSPFFTRWGVPVTEGARSEITNLREWAGP